ncbi:MAG: hypothetical protein PVH00_02860 [Gemmatimonadota bacterium]|jgi:hypothetical protein
MIVRRYGRNIQSVTPNFDAHAMTEVGFVRGDWSMGADEFEQKYERKGGRELTATGQGSVQNEAEDAVLVSLREQLIAFEASLGEGELLMIEDEPGVHYPKTRGRQLTAASSGPQTRISFEYTIDPPLHVGVYRPR